MIVYLSTNCYFNIIYPEFSDEYLLFFNVDGFLDYFIVVYVFW